MSLAAPIANDTNTIYPPLDERRGEIRLLKILPGKNEEPLVCSTTPIRLKKWPSPKFQALSYCWGDPKVTKAITVNGREVQVTTNLEAALRQLRSFHGVSKTSYRSSGTYLWIDAICINQADLKEKSSQVPLMTDIYTAASHVLIWLGEGDKGTDIFIDWANTTPVTGDKFWTGSAKYTLHHDLNLRDLQKMAKEVFAEWPADILWLSLVSLFRPWFGRIWTLQEAVLAKKDPLVICGTRTILLPELAGVLKLTHIASGWLRKQPSQKVEPILAKAFRAQSFSTFREQFEASHARVEHMMDLRTTWSRSLFPQVEDAFEWTEYHQATDPRDQVYGLLGIIHRKIQPKVHVTYEKEPWEIYLQAITAAFEDCSFLNLTLRYRHKADVDTTKPSWLPDLSQVPDSDYDFYLSYESSHKIWLDQPKLKIGEDGRVISVPITMLDVVDVVEILEFAALDYQTTLQNVDGLCKIAHSIELEEAHALYQFKRHPLVPWSVLTLNSPVELVDLSAGEDRHAVYQEMWEDLLKGKSTTRPPGTQHFFSDWWWTRDANYPRFAQEIRQRTRNLSFFTTQAGLVGLGPRCLKQSDNLGIIYGTKSLSAVRTLTDGQYILLGPVYLHELTDHFRDIYGVHRRHKLTKKVIDLV